MISGAYSEVEAVEDARDAALDAAHVEEKRGPVRKGRLAEAFLADAPRFRLRISAVTGDLDVCRVDADLASNPEEHHVPRAFPSSHSSAATSSVNVRIRPPRLVTTISPKRSG